MINYLFHYFRMGSRPFQSLSTLPEAQAIPLMKSLYVPGSILWQRFANPIEYIRLRRKIEGELFAKFRVKGGHPKQEYPIYFVVGKPKWAVASDDRVTMETTSEIRIPLNTLKEDEISFTYPDSMLCVFARQIGIDPKIDDEYDGKVFTLKEVELLINSKGLPAEGWTPQLKAGLSHYIEAQVWNHKVLEEYINNVDGHS